MIVLITLRHDDDETTVFDVRGCMTGIDRRQELVARRLVEERGLGL
jgi:hypothetical protein